MTKSTDYVIASTRSAFANSPVSFHEPCLRTGAPPGSSRQEFRKSTARGRSHGQDASTEENNGNSEHRTNGTTEEPSPKPTTNTSPNNKLRQDKQLVQRTRSRTYRVGHTEIRRTRKQRQSAKQTDVSKQRTPSTADPRVGPTE